MLNFLYTAVSWVLLRWHDLFNAIGVGANWAWALSIVFLVITARLLLFRLFVKQVHYQRNMQKIQPKIQKLREKHKGDKAALNREMMALQQSEGFNPLAGCLPMFLQIPVFIGLYHVLRHISNSNRLCNATTLKGSNSKLLELYTFSGGQKGETCDAARAHIFNAPLAASFRDSSSIIRGLGGDPSSTKILLVILLIISASATFATQLLVRANATTPAEGTAATVQKLMLYLIPVGTLASGLLFNFPLGVLLYWFTSNLWTLGQQGYIIRFHPPADEGTPATVGAVGKTLAPKPGQRPVRMSKNGTSATSAASGSGDAASTGGAASRSVSGAGAGSAGTSGGATRSEPARGAVPRPGQRPNRPSGKRPPAKRATQTKKRR
ncbi:membrane protein insertase YidC [uncultured Jatrophihabitans sp.]|uniref:membrane protein insertase YidC n=1 Tax=uncultured Jatrophihabitans sp. TaxID=1610747 RepID=UPI0035CADDCC